MRTLSVAIAIVALALPAGAQTGGVSGDIYLQMKNGDVRQGVGRTVTLIPLNAPFRSALKSICGSFVKTIGAIDEEKDRLRESIRRADLQRDEFHVREAQERLRDEDQEREAALDAIAAISRAGSRAGAQTVKSGVSAKYRFSGVRSGMYRVMTTWTLYDTDYLWWTPVRVGAAAIKQDLDNEDVFDLSLRSSVEIICKTT